MTARRSTWVDPRRDPDDDARAAEGVGALRLADEAGEHPLGGVEVGDDAVAHRPDGGDGGRRAAQHGARLVSDRFGLLGGGVDGDNRRLVNDDAAAGGKNNRVGGAEVDGEVTGPEGQDVRLALTVSQEVGRCARAIATPVPAAGKRLSETVVEGIVRKNWRDLMTRTSVGAPTAGWRFGERAQIWHTNPTNL